MSIFAIQGIQEVNTVQPVRLRGRSESTPRTEARDAVEISPSAQIAAEAAKYAVESPGTQFRQAQVEAAKQRIEDGSYRLYDVVSQVAARISGLV